jgi:hypothetical protein
MAVVAVSLYGGRWIDSDIQLYAAPSHGLRPLCLTTATHEHVT